MAGRTRPLKEELRKKQIGASYMGLFDLLFGKREMDVTGSINKGEDTVKILTIQNILLSLNKYYLLFK